MELQSMLPNYGQKQKFLLWEKCFINTYDSTSKRDGHSCAAGAEIKLESFSGGYSWIHILDVTSHLLKWRMIMGQFGTCFFLFSSSMSALAIPVD